MKNSLKYIAALVVVGGLGLGVKMLISNSNSQIIDYRTSFLQKEDLISSINSNGTLEPSDAIDVGAQVSAMIMSFGKDSEGNTIDFGSEVKADTVLANLDDEVYQAEFTQAKANELQAKAQKQQADIEVSEAEANIKSAEVALRVQKAELAERERTAGKTKNEWDRTQRLGKEYASEQTYDEAYWDYQIALAAVDSAKAAIEQAEVALEQAKIQLEISKTKVIQAEATVEQAQAKIVSARRNLEYCVIKAPVDGVIIDRRVNVGQTVSAGLSAPSLFLLAKDLTQMQVWVSVNEADIGQIKKDMPVTFTVDAFPQQVFKGTVGKIRLNASMTSNVVLYIVEVDTDNSSGLLLPYLTADVSFEIARNNQVFTVPNSALRYTPSSGTVDSQEPLIWIKDQDGKPLPLQVQTGLTDGIKTEVSGDNLKEGMEVITAETILTKEEKAKQQTVNPFMPSPGRGKNAKKK